MSGDGASTFAAHLAERDAELLERVARSLAPRLTWPHDDASGLGLQATDPSELRQAAERMRDLAHRGDVLQFAAPGPTLARRLRSYASAICEVEPSAPMVDRLFEAARLLETPLAELRTPTPPLEGARRVAVEVLRLLEEKREVYGDSWKRRGGVGAYMGLARPGDRLERIAERYSWDIFAALYGEGDDAEGATDALRDLVGYALLILGEHHADARPDGVAVNLEALDHAEVTRSCDPSDLEDAVRRGEAEASASTGQLEERLRSDPRLAAALASWCMSEGCPVPSDLGEVAMMRRLEALGALERVGGWCRPTERARAALERINEPDPQEGRAVEPRARFQGGNG